MRPHGIKLSYHSLGVTSLVWQTFHSVLAPSIDRTYRPEKKVGRLFEFEEIYNVHENTSFIKRERDTERENSNSKTLILKDSSVRSIWTYLTASSCYTTNTNQHDYTTNIYYKHRGGGGGGEADRQTDRQSAQKYLYTQESF